MKIKLLPAVICFTCLLFKVLPSVGQLTGIKTIPGAYATVSLAVTALNTTGVGAGGVTFNVAADYTEAIIATISITATGAIANPILFQKDRSTIGTNPLITAYTFVVDQLPLLQQYLTILQLRVNLRSITRYDKVLHAFETSS